MPVLLRWLTEEQPDIVCLQELKAPQEKFPEDAIRAVGYEAIWHGQKSWNGVAVLSKGYTMHEVSRTLAGNLDDIQSRYLEVIVEGIHVCCIYLPNGNPYPGPKFDYKLNWIDRFKKRTAELVEQSDPVVIFGDFNIIPTELDVYKPEKWVHDALFRVEVREAYTEILQQGWTDALRTLFPNEKIYTFWDYFRNAYGRDAGLRIDHALLNPVLAKKLIAGGIDRHVRGWEKTSDHAPVWIQI